MDPALQLRDFGLAHSRSGAEEVLFEHVDLELSAGGFFAFVGTSGGGKSSLLRVLAGLTESREPPPRMTGELLVFGEDLASGRASLPQGSVAAVLHEEGLLDELSPRQNVELALSAAGRSRKLAPALLAQAGIPAPPDRIAQLSGGMRKRVAVARALASSPRLLLCDEPTAGLDPAAAREVARVLRAAHDQQPQRTTIVITHDLDAFDGLSDGVLVLDRAARSLRLELPAWRPVPAARTAAEIDPPPHGAYELAAAHGIRRWLLQAAAISETVLDSLRRLPPVELGLAARTAARFVLEPALFVAAAGAVIGGLATFFALRNNPIEGGFETALLTGAGKVSAAVLVPMLSGFFFTARVAAGAAARIGTMKRTQQIAALRMMGIRPADYLLTPLVWGMVLATPIVTLGGVVAAALASAFAAQVASGTSAASWATAYFAAIEPRDALVVLTKATLSGYLVALACYHLGTGPKRSGAEVGAAVDAAIVVGMALVLAVHAVLTFVVYA